MVEYHYSKIKYWTDVYSDLKHGDIISNSELISREKKLTKELSKYEIWSGNEAYRINKNFTYSELQNADRILNSNKSLRYLVIPYKLIIDYFDKWDLYIPWNLVKIIFDRSTHKHSIGRDCADLDINTSKYVSTSVLNSYKKYGLARPLINVEDNEWANRFTHRIQMSAYIKSDIPMFIDSSYDYIVGFKDFTRNNLGIDIQIENDKLIFIEDNKKIGFVNGGRRNLG